MYNRRYDKSFIMLRQESTGFSCGEKPASGTSAIEIKNNKGKLTTYVQGLGKIGNYSHYDVYFITSNPKRTKGLNVGDIDVDDIGHGSLKWEFDPDNVGGTGLPVEEFNIVAVMMKNGKTQNNIVVPIAGYRDSKINWKNDFTDFADKEDLFKPIANEYSLAKIKDVEEAVIVESPHIIEDLLNESKPKIIAASIDIDKATVETINNEDYVTTKEISSSDTDKINDDIDNNDINKYATESDFYGEFHIMSESENKEENPHKTFKELAVKFNKELDALEEAGVLSIQELEKINSAGTLTNANNDIEYMFINNPKMSPFNNDSSCDWVRICIDELALLPFQSCIIMNHPFIVSGYKRYKHLILGKDNKSKGKYVLGVPDAYMPEYNMRASRLGFNMFRGFKDEIPTEGDYGYWIMDVF